MRQRTPAKPRCTVKRFWTRATCSGSYMGRPAARSTRRAWVARANYSPLTLQRIWTRFNREGRTDNVTTVPKAACGMRLPDSGLNTTL